MNMKLRVETRLVGSHSDVTCITLDSGGGMVVLYLSPSLYPFICSTINFEVQALVYPTSTFILLPLHQY